MGDLQTIKALVKYAMRVDDFEVKGVVDTSSKILACYLAEKLTQESSRTIAKYFQINERYMLHRIENFSIELLMNDASKSIVSELEKLYKELEHVKISNQ